METEFILTTVKGDTIESKRISSNDIARIRMALFSRAGRSTSSVVSAQYRRIADTLFNRG